MITNKSYVLQPKDKDYFLKLIAEKGMTQVDVCKKVGITYTMLWMILRGKRTISQETYNKFVELGIDFEQNKEVAK